MKRALRNALRSGSAAAVHSRRSFRLLGTSSDPAVVVGLGSASLRTSPFLPVSQQQQQLHQQQQQQRQRQRQQEQQQRRFDIFEHHSNSRNGCDHQYWAPSAKYSGDSSQRYWENRFFLLFACAVAAVLATTAGGLTAECAPKPENEFEEVYYLANEAPNLGSGSFGTVSTAVHKATGNIVAVKRIPRLPHLTFADIAWEVEVLKLAGEHHNITHFYDLFEDDRHFYLTMELARGGELFDLLLENGPPSEASTALLIKTLMRAVSFVHMHGIIHGDIKPENVFLTNSSKGDVDWQGVKLGDFGSSAEVALAESATGLETRGTVAYNPPESLIRMQNKEEAVVTPAGDVWALGVVLFMLLTGEHPFASDMSISDEEMAKCVLQAKDAAESGSKLFEDERSATPYLYGEVNKEEGGKASVSPLARNLIMKMLRKDPEKRATAKEVLRHPWFLHAAEGLMPGPGRHYGRVVDLANKEDRWDFMYNLGKQGSLKFQPMTHKQEALALQKFWSARRRLKAALLAIMTGLVDGALHDLMEEEEEEKEAERRLAGQGGGSADVTRSDTSVRSLKRERRQQRQWRKRDKVLEATDYNTKKKNKGAVLQRQNTLGSGSGAGSKKIGAVLNENTAVTVEEKKIVAAAAAAAAAESGDSDGGKQGGKGRQGPPFPVGSREAACGMIDHGRKGYVNGADIERVTKLMGEKFNRLEIKEMMRAMDGNPCTESHRVPYEHMVKVIPPLCPPKKVGIGRKLYREGDMDPTLYLLTKGVVEFSVSALEGKAPLQQQGPGALFGEVELLRADGSTAPRLATCKCLGEQGGGGCEVLVLTDYMFELLTDVYVGVRAKLSRQAGERMEQLAGSVLQNAFDGEESSVMDPDVIWGEKESTRVWNSVRPARRLKKRHLVVAPLPPPSQQQQEQPQSQSPPMLPESGSESGSKSGLESELESGAKSRSSVVILPSPLLSSSPPPPPSSASSPAVSATAAIPSVLPPLSTSLLSTPSSSPSPSSSLPTPPPPSSSSSPSVSSSSSPSSLSFSPPQSPPSSSSPLTMEERESPDDGSISITTTSGSCTSSSSSSSSRSNSSSSTTQSSRHSGSGDGLADGGIAGAALTEAPPAIMEAVNVVGTGVVASAAGKEESTSTFNSEGSFVLFVLEGYVTAVYGEESDGGNSGTGGYVDAAAAAAAAASADRKAAEREDKSRCGINITRSDIKPKYDKSGKKIKKMEGFRREEVLVAGDFCFCGEGFGAGVPESPRLVKCKEGQQARVLRVPAAKFDVMMNKKTMAALTEYMFSL